MAYVLLLPFLLWLPPAVADDPRWLREPALSPDGKKVAFTWQGRIYLSNSEGGAATPLTGTDYLSQRPVWSPDGKLIAFAADLYGNDDVFVVPASGGKMVRLTRDSRSDIPHAFSDDSKRLLLSSQRPWDPQADHFIATEWKGSALHWVPVAGGAWQADQPLPVVMASPHGSKLAYQMPSVEQLFRKHQRSFAVSRLWLFDGKQHRQLTEDRIAASNPVWGNQGNSLFYLSERSGDFNVWRRDLGSGKEQQLTHYKGHPVRGLSASLRGDLVWSWLGELYRLDAGSTTPRKLNITPLAADSPDEQSKWLTQVDEAVVNEQGDELIVVSEGNLYAIDSQRERVRQLTHQLTEESSPLYADQGKTLIYLSEQAGHAALYRLTTSDPQHAFSAPGSLTERLLLAMPGKGISRPTLSPDGQQLAFVVDGQAVHLLNLATSQQRELIPASFNTRRHQVQMAFAPDSQHLAVSIQLDTAQQEIAVIDTRDPKARPTNVSLNGYYDFNPMWSNDGSVLYWESSKHGVLGADGEPVANSLLGIYSTRSAKADFLAERTPPKTGYSFDITSLAHREALTLVPQGGVLASKIVAGKLIYVVEVETPQGESDIRGYELDLRKGEIKLLFEGQPGSALVSLNQSGTTATLVKGGEVIRVPLDGSDPTSHPFALIQTAQWHSKIVAAFDQFARITRDEFYRDDMNGVDWDDYVATYRTLLPSINNIRDFSQLLGELTGELNVSHTWGGSPAPALPLADYTASLGGYWRDGQQGVELAALLTGGPLEQESDIGAGTRLLAVNGEAVATVTDLERLLNHQDGNRLSLSVQPVGSKEPQQIEVTAIDLEQESQLKLASWVVKRRDRVASLSQGRVGYVYVTAMNAQAYEDLVTEALGRLHNSEVLIVDVRFNKGGLLANTLVEFLTGNRTEQGMAIVSPRIGQGVTEATGRQWTKPSLIITNPDSYSEGSAFPTYYRALKIGPIVGEPVPGTGTEVYVYQSKLLPGLSQAIPAQGLRHPDGTFYENQELIPDVQVALTPNDMVAGRDPQLEAAVQTALTLLPPVTQ
ncbi:S41 family peptidase [Aeromonas cavernicola]|uniref:Tricorn protease homolog n=1 Tax=Aeromonas cavernicola TaxID=1006623 RepID=A0A2H9U122_9GAMM|nr:S41 family peptidase [Aeromonas cavernicola]PJG57700.1 peptidase S41 [Aeromonas cavernicola]